MMKCVEIVNMQKCIVLNCTCTLYLNSFWLSGVYVSDAIVLFLMEGHRLDVVKHTQKVCLDSVGIRCLSQNLEKSWIRHKEEAREHKSLLLQVPGERLLAELKLL